jgi:hypothetical protein
MKRLSCLKIGLLPQKAAPQKMRVSRKSTARKKPLRNQSGFTIKKSVKSAESD